MSFSSHFHSNRIGQNHDKRQIDNQEKGIKKASFLDIITFRGKQISLDGEKVWVNKASLAKFVIANLPSTSPSLGKVGFFDHILVSHKILEGLAQIETSDQGAVDSPSEDEPPSAEQTVEDKTNRVARQIFSPAQKKDDALDPPKKAKSFSLSSGFETHLNTLTPQEVEILRQLGVKLSEIQNAGPSEIKQLRKKIERETDQVRQRDREARAAGQASSKKIQIDNEKRKLRGKRNPPQ